MNKNQKATKWIIGGVILLILIVAAVLVWNAPLLGKPLHSINTLIIGIRVVQEATQAELGLGAKSPTIPNLDLTPTAVLTRDLTSNASIPVEKSQAKPICGGPEHTMLLALGVDDQTHSGVIWIIQIDYQNKKVIGLSIPRDLYLPLPGFEVHQITQDRLNLAYGFGEKYLGPGQGVIATANALSGNFGLFFDRYIVSYDEVFEKIIDQVGGIDVTLEKEANGFTDGHGVFAAGTHHLLGADALALVRIRNGDNDPQWYDRQTLVIQALTSKITASMNIIELASLGIQTIKDKGILTDLSIGDLYSIACFGKALTPEDISFVNIPKDLYQPATSTTGGSIITPREGLVPFVQELFGVSE